MRQIVNTANALELHTRHILKSTASNENDVMFLKVVADARNVGDHFLAGRQSHKDALSVGGVWLTRFFDQHLENDAFCEGLSVEWLTWRAIFEVWTGAVHLTEGRHVAL